jgi:hypothetical protein
LPVISQWPLIGRSEELAVIADAARATGDRTRGIVLSGAAGVGRTRVAREAVAFLAAPTLPEDAGEVRSLKLHAELVWRGSIRGG